MYLKKSRKFIFALFLILIGVVPAYAQSGLETLAQPIRNLFEHADIVAIGEYHSMANHKDVFQATMTPLVQSNTIDTIAVEFIQYTDNDLLREYLQDPQATTGSQKETQYFLRFSNCDRRCGEYGQPGAWPIMGEPYQNLLREMRRLQKAYPLTRFCGFNSDQFYTHQFNEIHSDFVGINQLPVPLRQLGNQTFGDLFAAKDTQYGWGSASLRELRFAIGMASCLKESKKSLVFAGGFHAMQISKIRSTLPASAQWASALDLVSQLTSKQVRSGEILTSSSAESERTTDGVYGARFQSKYRVNAFTLRSANSFTPELVADATEHGYSSIPTYDFVIFGPASNEIQNIYKMPGKAITDYPVAAGELTNISFEKQRVELQPHLAKWKIDGKTSIDFNLKKNGRFIFQYWGFVKSIRLDGETIVKKEMTIAPSANAFMSPIYAVNRELDSRKNHTVEIEFRVPPGSFTIFEGEKGKLLEFGTRDFNDYGISAQWIFPTINLPTVRSQMNVSIANSDDFKTAESDISCNCVLSESRNFAKLDFGAIPHQQVYFQIHPRAVANSRFEFDARAGLKVQSNFTHFFYGGEFLRQERDLIKTKDSLDKDLFKPFKETVTQTIGRMETLIGPYPHGRRLVIGVHSDYRGDSMEYQGAVHTGLGSLVHEIIHQWFATSVKPQTNADSWLLESITVWLEQKKFADLRIKLEPFMKSRDPNFQSVSIPESTPVDQDKARQLLRDTRFCPTLERKDLCEGFSLEWYVLGPQIFDAVDTELTLKSNGKITLVTLLREFFSRYHGQHVDLSQLIRLLKEKQPDGHWDEIFNFAK